jgi:hypothetical protein
MILQNVTSGATGVEVRLNDLIDPENFKDIHGPAHNVIVHPTMSIELENDWRTLRSYDIGDIKKAIDKGWLLATEKPFTSSAIKTKVNALCVIAAIPPLP